MRTAGVVQAAGGFSSKLQYAKLGTAAAGSVAVTGITTSDRLEAAVAFKLSGALIKTVADMLTACALGTSKVTWSSVKACSNGLLLIWWQDL